MTNTITLKKYLDFGGNLKNLPLSEIYFSQLRKNDDEWGDRSYALSLIPSSDIQGLFLITTNKGNHFLLNGNQITFEVNVVLHNDYCK